jgi:hypothetical protein
MKNIVRVTALGLAFVTLLPAVPILSLYNTGVDNAGALLVGGNGVVDPHYTLLSGPGVSGTPNAVTYFNAAYIADGPSSRWISLNSSGSPTVGDYVFRTTFDLTGFDPNATSITFNCAADNRVADVQINGVSVFGLGNSCDSYVNLGAPRLIDANFVSGINTLDFTVRNDDSLGPMAFRVEYTSDTTALPSSEVPEPGTLLLSAAGIAAAQLCRLRARARSR